MPKAPPQPSSSPTPTILKPHPNPKGWELIPAVFEDVRVILLPF